MTEGALFLDVAQILRVHERSIAEHGGDPGIRDRGLLESAVAMPRASFGGERLHRTVPATAAAYLFHLCSNHPFVDGNKRTALAAAEVFLAVNGWRLAADDAAVYELTMGVAAGERSKAAVTAFFEEHCRESAPG